MKKQSVTNKFLAILMGAVMAFSLMACGSKESGENAVEIPDALTLLNAVWDSYEEEEKFPAAGGDFTEENSVMDAPGKYGIEDPAVLDSVFGLPEASFSKIDDAASLVHMMNANTFTCGVFHVSDSGDVPEVADSLKENILSRQWMCGFPDKLIVIRVGDYVVSAFGNEELMNNFKAKTMTVYETAELVCEEAVE